MAYKNFDGNDYEVLQWEDGEGLDGFAVEDKNGNVRVTIDKRGVRTYDENGNLQDELKS